MRNARSYLLCLFGPVWLLRAVPYKLRVEIKIAGQVPHYDGLVVRARGEEMTVSRERATRHVSLVTHEYRSRSSGIL